MLKTLYNTTFTGFCVSYFVRRMHFFSINELSLRVMNVNLVNPNELLTVTVMHMNKGENREREKKNNNS